MNQASCTIGAPVDFYAGALASCAIILFAKFVTHGKGALAGKSWRVAHYLCVASAWFGLTIALYVLSDLVPNIEQFERTVRPIVFVLLLVASAIFSVDVDQRCPALAREVHKMIQHSRGSSGFWRHSGSASVAGCFLVTKSPASAHDPPIADQSAATWPQPARFLVANHLALGQKWAWLCIGVRRGQKVATISPTTWDVVCALAACGRALTILL